MKYCTKCGHQMADDMLFCQKCGTKCEPIKTVQTAEPQPTEVKRTPPQQTYTVPTVNTQTTPGNKKVIIRKGMKVGMIICFVFAVIYGLISITEPSIFAMTLFFFVLGLMFLSLGLVPKESKYMYFLGKSSKVKKNLFVVMSIIVAFTIFGISMSINPPETTKDNSASQQLQNILSSDENKNDQQSATETKPQEDKTTLSDIEKWYTNQTSAVSQSLMEYAKSIDGLTSLNVNSSKFRFGKDSGWYDCHYTFIFTCKVNGTTYNGEARAFMKYQDNTVNWFHFEIFSNTGVQSLVEHYDDSYDQIIEDYYKELESGNIRETPTTQPNNNSSDKPTTPHTHSYSSWEYYDESRHYRPCSSCSESKYEAHKWNSGTTTKTASCTQEGTLTYICTVCDAEKYESIPLIEHKWDNGTVTQNATCSKEGVMTYFCSSCVAEKHDSIPKTSHEFDQKVTDTSYLKSRATYTTGSVYYYSCVCGEKGAKTFSLDDRIEWITTDMLRKDYNLTAGWIGGVTDGELRLWTYQTGIGERGDSYLIYDKMRNGMGDSVYEGSYNGVTVRFYVIRHSSHYAFYYDDLVAAGIISALAQ